MIGSQPVSPDIGNRQRAPLRRRGARQRLSVRAPGSQAHWRVGLRLREGRLDKAGLSPIARPLPSFAPAGIRSEEHTSELQSLMRISYAVFCLKKKNKYSTEPRYDN